VIQKAWPRRGEFFALGGSTLFRGFDLAEKQGSFLWVANAEARLPVLRDLRWNFVDRVIGIRNVYFAAFYDVGGVYVNGSRVGSVAHALGGGFRVDASFFSFIERATVRFDFAKTLNAATPFQFWFGVQHPF
jgi:hemolysin activation/secretion protein